MKRPRASVFILFFILFAVLALAVLLQRRECLHPSVERKTLPPSCISEGYEISVCKHCEKELERVLLPPTPHKLVSSVTPPSCEALGYTAISCEACGLEYQTNFTAPIGHDLTIESFAPTCQSCGYDRAACSRCDFEYVCARTPTPEHSFEATAAPPSARRQTGYTVYSCACGVEEIGDYVFYSDVFEGAYASEVQPIYKGVDTSYHNHSVSADGSYLPLDWTAIRSEGYGFAILRAGYMGVRDKVFDMDYADARAAGLFVGAYFYSYADSVEEARSEALFCLELLEGKTFDFPIFLDIEDSRLEALGKDLLTDICVEFISILQENGYYAALYTNNYWLTTLLETQKIATLFDIWYARFSSPSEVITEAVWNEKKYGRQTVMWQFSQTGIIDGVVRPDGSAVYFDLNYSYKDYPSIIRSLGYNGFSQE